MKALSFKGKATIQRVQRILQDEITLGKMKLNGDLSVLEKRLGTYFGYKLKPEGLSKAKKGFTKGVYEFFRKNSYINYNLRDCDSLTVDFKIEKKEYARSSAELIIVVYLRYKFTNEGEVVDTGVGRTRIQIPIPLKDVKEVD